MPLLRELVEGTSIAGERLGGDLDLLPSVELGLASDTGCGEDGPPADSGACEWV